MSSSRLIMPSLWLSSAFLAAIVPLVNSQQVVLFPASLPSCISTCTTLEAAETGCVPPSAPVSSTAIYESCFCQSALLTSLATSAANICPGICSDADYATIYSWYKGFCNVAGAATPNTPPTTTNPAGAAATSDGSSSTQNPSWISTHYNWVIMLIVLVVGLILVAVLGSWLHRRHRRRREEAENAGPRPDLQTWGPNQGSVHDLGTAPPTDSFGGTAEKGKGKARAGEITRASGSKRLTKESR